MPITDKLSIRNGRVGRWGFIGLSAGVHAALLTALVVATAEPDTPAMAATEGEKVTYVDIREFAPPPPPAPSSAAEQPETPEQQPQTRPEPTPQPQRPRPQPRTPARATDVIDPVDSIPPEPLGSDLAPEPVAPVTPAIRPSVTPSAGQTGGQAGGVEGGVEGGKEGGVVGGQGEKTLPPGGTYTAAVVDQPAELTNRNDLPRLMQRFYPPALRSSGIGGRVVVQFVVDTNGKVDMSTVKIQSSSRDGFEDATRNALREFRFRAARKGSERVRMLMQLPIVWEVMP